jgi:hypothetical protein
VLRRGSGRKQRCQFESARGVEIILSESGSTSIPGIPAVLVVAQRLLQNKSVIPQTPYTSVHPIDPDVLVLTLMVLYKGLVTLLSGKRVDRG